MEYKTISNTQITKDWANAFPEFGIYKPLWIGRRIGPIVHGIYFETRRINGFKYHKGGGAYRPLQFMFCLTEIFDATKKNLPISIMKIPSKIGVRTSIDLGLHDDYFKQTAAFIREDSIIPLAHTLSVTQLIEIYQERVSLNIDFVPKLLTDTIQISIYLKDKTLSLNLLDENSIKYMDRLKFSDKMLGTNNAKDEFDFWYARQIHYIENPQILFEQVEENAKILEVGKLPYMDILLE